MFEIKKSFEIAGAHKLQLNYNSKCSDLHGHNWKITVWCRASELNENGMVVDFTHIKKRIADTIDHKNLNDIFDFNPTAENIAKWVCEQVDMCYKVQVEESEGNYATYVCD